MSTTAVLAQQGVAADHCSTAAQQVPLTFMKPGESGVVVKVRGNGDTLRHLENLGFVPGARIRVANTHGGDYIVEVKGAQIALDRTVCSRIIAAL